jgi:PKD domain-containing protein
VNGKTRRHRVLALVAIAMLAATSLNAEDIRLEAKDTLTALEMDHGDQLRFRLRNGRVVSLLLGKTDAAIVEEIKPGGIVYRFSATCRIDGQSMRLERYVCSQECYYEPWVINGLRIWLDTVRDVFDVVPVRYPRKGNLQCVPRKAARLAVQDATLRICPDQIQPWIEHEGPTLDVGKCYNGDDCYLGPYLGQACHVGMDINQAKGSLLFAPIRFDTQGYFNSLAAGDNNNRWRGIRRWKNGDVWALQTHHLIDLLVPENAPLEASVNYATTAGVHVGSHEHTHFEFKIGRPRDVSADDSASIAAPIDFDDESEVAQEQPDVLHLDPWILFWQSFEDQRQMQGKIRAAMKPLGPAKVGEEVQFSAIGSRPGPNGKDFRCSWTFGDSGSESGLMTTHAFPRPGVIPVRLVVDDGVDRDSTIQWITVSGTPSKRSALAIVVPDEPSCRPWPSQATETYGQPLNVVPNTIRFLARATNPQHSTRVELVDLLNKVRPAELPPMKVNCPRQPDWLLFEQKRHDGKRWLDVQTDASGLKPGIRAASLQITYPGLLLKGARHAGLTHDVRVELHIPAEPPETNVTIDDADPGFYATPHFWVGHRFCRCPADRRGYAGFYLTNGTRPTAREFARFTPDLQAGEYDVSLSDETPFSPGVEFDVRVRHADGDETVRMRPEEGRTIGTFRFDEGADGFVEILAEGSKGLVIADAVIFRRL